MKRLTQPLLLLLAAAGLTGCIASQETTITLLGVEADAAINQPPIFLTEDPHTGRFEVSAGFSVATGGDWTGQLPLPLTPLPPEFDNPAAPDLGIVRWTPADGSFAVNMQYMLGAVFALTGGFNYAWGKQTAFWGGNLGIGLMAGSGTVAFRVDGGILIRPAQYDALTMVHTRTTTIFGGVYEETGVFLDQGRSTAVDFYGSLTLNGTSQTSPVDFFLNAGVSHQTLAAFSPQDQLLIAPFTGVISVVDQRTDVDAMLYSVTPGVLFRLGRSQRILAGARMVGSFTSDVLESRTTWIPFIQIDFILAGESEERR